MAKFKINYQVTPNGSISWQHLGDDAQWAESGAAVKLLWQCNAGWGLQEAHYTTEGGVTVPIDITADVPQFVMPAENITIGGTFKRFVLGDWTDGHHETDDEVKIFKKGVNGQPVAVPAGEIVQGSTDSELSSTSENPVQNKVITEFLEDLVEGLKDGSVDVLASDIKPKSSAVIDTADQYNIRTTGGDNDIKNGAAALKSIRGSLDAQLRPFIADTFVSTKMNLVDPNQYITINYRKGYYFPVVKGAWGAYGTTQENNGYVIICDQLYTVYFSETKPTADNYGVACLGMNYGDKTYWMPTANGWLTVRPNSGDAPACHIAWSNYNDEVPGVFGNTTKNISTCLQWIHAWGMAGLVGYNRSVFDEISLEQQKCYRRTDRVKLADLTWTTTTATTGEGDQETTVYIFKATVSSMAADGLFETLYNGVTLSGNELTIRSTTLTSVEALLLDLGDDYIYFELGTTAITTFSDLHVTLPKDNTVDDFGLEYFLYEGEIATGKAYVEEEFAQSGKDQLFNNVTYVKIMAEAVATILCSLNERVKSLECKDTVKCTNLVVERRADISGWREVDAAPAAANSAGAAGDYFVATDYIYICVAPNTWKRASLSTF